MGWPYHFVTLTDAQKVERRQLLDRYAFIAQVSAIAPLLAIQCYYFVTWLNRRRATNRDEWETPSSPHLKTERLGSWTKAGGWHVRVRKLGWWLDEDLTVLGLYLGRKGQVLAAAVWLVWLLGLCFVQTGDDYLHLTKRFGIIAASQLPLHYLLALKSSYSPLQLLTRSSHETLNAWHQLFGRIIILTLYLHASFYINFYVQSNLVATKLQEAYILCGIFGIISLTAIGTTALAPLRRWSYRVFYFTHVTLAAAIMPVLFFHVSHIRIYLYEAATIYAANALLRTLNSRTLLATMKNIPRTNLVEVTIPSSTAASVQLRRWWGGQHAYLSLPTHPLTRTFRKNPFTLSSLPTVDGHLRFCARVLDGNTSLLAQQTGPHPTRLTLEGPYGVRTHADILLQYDRVLLVAGGVGATFVVPLYRQLLADLSPSANSHRRQKVRFIWVARTLDDVTWALPSDRQEREGFVERLEVFLTRPTSSTVADNGGALLRGSTASSSHHDDEMGDDDEEEGIELEERHTLLPPPRGDSKGGVLPPLHAGRPNLHTVVDETFSRSSSSECIAVVVCGPKNLNRILRQEVGRWVMKRGREVWFWEEVFAM